MNIGKRSVVLKILKIFQLTYGILAICVLLASVLGILLRAATLSEAWQTLSRIWNPFNILNFIMVIILFSPAIGAYWLKDYLERKWQL